MSYRRIGHAGEYYLNEGMFYKRTSLLDNIYTHLCMHL